MFGRGSSWTSAAYFSSASFASSVNFAGTATSTVTSRSPCPPASGAPRPRTRSVRPDGVPAGTFSDTAPSSVGTRIVVPSAASG